MPGISTTPEYLFWRWAGFLANPVRNAEIHAEMKPDKKAEFIDNYRQWTGEPLLLPGDKAPFYVWPPGTNKYGAQLRVYFRGTQGEHPANADGRFSVRSGRTPERTLRINNGDFVRDLFKAGFVIGKNADCADTVKKRAGKFVNDFNDGFAMMTAEESAEVLVKENCAQAGIRTVSSKELAALLKQRNNKAGNLLKQLCDKGVLLENKERGAYTLAHAEILPGELEKESAVLAVRGETNPDRREILLETYARDRGWVRLAKRAFGQKCMCENCGNAFMKNDGAPYIEAHHITPLHKGGEDGIWNLSVLCAHHHRMAHFARTKERNALKNYLQQENARRLKLIGAKK